MPTDPAAVLHRLTERLAPLERSLHLASWAAATDARPETSAARQQAEEALLAVLADPELFAEVEAAAGGIRGAGDGDPLTSRALGKARLDLLARQIPADARADLGPLLAGRDTVELTVAAYDGMGLETRHLLDRADLRPRPGKDQHAFCLDIDRAGDIRVLANVAPGEESLDTMLHEVGHAVYDDHVDRSLPWVLRCPPQPLATEAVALMLGRLRRDPELLVAVLGADPATAAGLAAPSREVLRTGQLVFARWCLVMVRFEQAMYADPGRDLAATWWDLVESLQGLRRPEGRTTPDWASKIHLAVAPVYYQSYLLGELMAFQVDAAVREAVGGFVGRPDAGAFLAERVFEPGASRTWRDLVVHATGRPLGPEAFLAGLEA